MPEPTWSRRLFLGRAGGVVLVGAAATGLDAWRIEPHWVEVVRRDLPIAHLPPALVSKTLVQLSDLHIGPQVEDEYLLASFRMVTDPSA